MLETQETWVLSLGGKDPWRRKWQPTPVFLLGKSHGQRSLTRCSPRGPKDLDMTERLNTQSLAIYVLKANSVFTSAFQWKLVVTLQTLIVKRTWVNLCFIYGNHSFEILSDAGRLNILQFNVCEAVSGILKIMPLRKIKKKTLSQTKVFTHRKILKKTSSFFNAWIQKYKAPKKFWPRDFCRSSTSLRPRAPQALLVQWLKRKAIRTLEM